MKLLAIIIVFVWLTLFAKALQKFRDQDTDKNDF